MKRRREDRQRRQGIVPLEVVLFLGTIFVMAVLLYWVAQTGFAGLFQIIAGWNGSPYL